MPLSATVLMAVIIVIYLIGFLMFVLEFYDRKHRFKSLMHALLWPLVLIAELFE